MTRQRHTITISTDQHMPAAAYQAEKTGRSWFVLGLEGHGTLNKIVDSVGRRGYEHYFAIEVTPDGEWIGHEANPRQS